MHGQVIYRRLIVSYLILLFLVVAAGCETGGHKTDGRVGNMDDFSYAGVRGSNYGQSANGNFVGAEEFEGKFVWVDYAAPWCGPCAPQASVIGKLDRTLGGKVVFLTVMTSDNEPFQEATRTTARLWAKRFGLNPDKVVAGRNSSLTIPQHVLFSPAGQTLYRETGLHSETLIKSTLATQMREWKAWNTQQASSL